MARESHDALTGLAKSPTVRKWLAGLLSAIALYVAGEVKGWIRGYDASLSRVSDVSKLERRIAAIEGFDVEAIQLESSGTAGLADEHTEAIKQLDIDVHRDLLRGFAPTRVNAAVKQYDALIAKGVKPHDAMDIVLGWSRPPGR